MISRPAPISVAEHTARQRSGITDNTGEPQNSKPPWKGSTHSWFAVLSRSCGIERATCGPFVPLRGCDFLELLSSHFLKPTQKRL